jgi:DNA-binding phage protein
LSKRGSISSLKDILAIINALKDLLSFAGRMEHVSMHSDKAKRSSLLCQEEIRMGKIETSAKRKGSEKRSLKAHKPFVNAEMRDPKLVADTLLDCIREGDLDAFREVLASHLLSVSKSQLAKRSGVGRRTLYDLMDPQKPFNPELSTVAAIISGLMQNGSSHRTKVRTAA